MPRQQKKLCDLELISLRQIADNWSCSRCTVARLLGNAGIEPIDFTGTRNGTKRYLKDEISRFLEGCKNSRPQKKSLRDVIASKRR